MSKLPVCLFLLVFLIFDQAGYAQRKEYIFSPLNAENSLSHSFVSRMLQDSRGFMWIGTRNGLNKYNGYNFTVYQHLFGDSTSIGGNVVTDLLEDRQGRLWVATLGGLSSYQPATNTFQQFSPHAAGPGLATNNIEALAEDQLGALWIGTDAGLYRYVQKTGTLQHYTHQENDSTSLSHMNVRELIADRQGRLWVGTSNGLNIFDRQKNSFIPFKLPAVAATTNYPLSIEVLFEDREGNIWVGTRFSGLYCINGESMQVQHFLHQPKNARSLSHNIILSLTEDAEGRLWVGTENEGLNVYDPRGGTFYHYKAQNGNLRSLPGNSIHALYRDRQNNIWVGTYSGGISIYDWNRKDFRLYTANFPPGHNLSHGVVKQFAEDERGHIWIATDGGGINVFNPLTQSFTFYKKDSLASGKSLSGNHITSIVVDKDSNVWAGVWGSGIDYFNRKTREFTHFGSQSNNSQSSVLKAVFALYEDSRGDIWAGTIGGLINIDKSSRQFTYYRHEEKDPYSLSDDHVTVIYEDSRQNLWVGTERGGLNLFNRATKGFISYKNGGGQTTSISSNLVSDIFEDSKGRLWIATDGALNLFNYESKQFEHYKRKGNLAFGTPKSIEEDTQGNLWIGSSYGLLKFNPETKEYKQYTRHDGLQGNDFMFNSSLKAKGGEMYFGGFQGFNVFHPDSIKQNPYVPPVYLTDFKIFNKEVAPGEDSPLKQHISVAEQIVIPYSQAAFSFEFAALNYSSPELNQYAYKLEGFDEEWNFVGSRRTAIYTNLDPGEYVFRVKASSNDGIWNEDGAFIKLIVTPPFWLTWWFRWGMGLLIAGLALAIHHARGRSIRRQKQALEQVVAQRTQSLQLANNQLLKREEELLAQNEQVDSQRNLLAQQNQKLEQARITIEEQNQNLDQQVKERTHELVEYNQQLEQFAFITAHNLRAPVARILGLGQVLDLLQAAAEEEKGLIISKLVASARDLDQVVRDLNEILEIRKDKTLPVSPINLQEELQLVKANLESEILSTGAQITEDFSKVDTIYTVKPYLDSILMNLLHNALKYRSPARRPCIDVKADRVQDLVCISVSDNGLGIDLLSYKDKLFNLYKRFHTHVTGKGLGLYLIKTQVTAIGGRIEVDSEVDQGTTFRVYLKNEKGAFS